MSDLYIQNIFFATHFELIAKKVTYVGGTGVVYKGKEGIASLTIYVSGATIC